MRSSERLLALISAMAVSVAGELPLFNYTYNMQQSTIAMPCNYTGKTTCMQSASSIKRQVHSSDLFDCIALLCRVYGYVWGHWPVRDH